MHAAAWMDFETMLSKIGQAQRANSSYPRQKRQIQRGRKEIIGYLGLVHYCLMDTNFYSES